MTRRRGVVATTLAVLAAGLVAAGCGGGGNNGTANLNFYIFPEPSGSFDKAAKTGVVHINSASRKKSRLSARLARLK